MLVSRVEIDLDEWLIFDLKLSARWMNTWPLDAFQFPRARGL